MKLPNCAWKMIMMMINNNYNIKNKWKEKKEIYTIRNYKNKQQIIKLKRNISLRIHVFFGCDSDVFLPLPQSKKTGERVRAEARGIASEDTKRRSFEFQNKSSHKSKW